MRFIQPLLIPTLLSATLMLSSNSFASDKDASQDGLIRPESQHSYNDPNIGFNKAMFSVNQLITNVAVIPIAHVYTEFVWTPVQTSISNFYNNIGNVTSIPNDLLQGKPDYFFNDLGRLLLNSTIGIGGLFDVAKHMGLPPHKTGFGDTFALWGWKPSTYIVLPVFGPRTLRDTFAMPFNWATDPNNYLDKDDQVAELDIGQYLSRQAKILPAIRAMNKSFAPYVFMRNGYLQRRSATIAKLNMPYKTYVQQSQTQSNGKAYGRPSS